MGRPLSIFGIGDSILSPDCQFNNSVDPFAELVMPKLDGEIEWLNNSWPGRTTENLASFIEEFTRDRPIVGTVFLFQLGTNDFNNVGRELRGYQEISTAVRYLKSRGAITAVCTLLPRDDQYLAGSGWNAFQEEYFAAYNELMRREHAGADYVVDLASDSVMGTYDALGDLSLYADRLHPTLSGWRILAPHFVDFVKKVTARV